MDDMDCSQPPAHAQLHGLLNQGSTCYLNSVLQVLFMTRDFREGVERHTREKPHTEWIDPQLKDLFDDLQQGEAYTYNITKKLGIKNVYEQRDAAEYFEKILSLTNPDASQIFHGECTHKTMCSECGACSDADGYFWHLPLELLDSYSEDYSVMDGLKQYFQTSNFDGENQMYCDRCDAKSDATTKYVMKHHPEVLALLLKRFDFDYSYMRYVKNNRAVDIPSILQLPKNQTYKLYALVEHFGDLRSGHYTATVKSPDDEIWYNFNDARVTLIHCPLFQGNIIAKSSSVYLLFYKKTKTRVAETCTHRIIDNSSPGDGEEGEKRTEVGDDICMDIDQPKTRVDDQDHGSRQESQGWNDVSSRCDDPLAAHAEKPKQDKKDIVEDDQERGQAAQRELFLTNNQLKDSKGSVLVAHTEKQKQNEGNALKDGEDGGHTGADEQVEQSRGEDLEALKQNEVNILKDDDEGDRQTEADEQVGEDQDFISAQTDDEKLDISDRLERVCKEDEMIEVQRGVLNLKMPRVESSQGDGEETKVEFSLENLVRDTQNQAAEGLDGVRKSLNKDQEDVQNHDKQVDMEKGEIEIKDDRDRQTVAHHQTLGKRQHFRYDLYYLTVSEDKRRVLEKRELDDEGDQEGATGGESKALLTKYDLYCQSLQYSAGGGQKRSEEVRLSDRRERRASNRGKEQNRRDDEPAQREETSTTKHGFSASLEDENERESEDFKQNKANQQISVFHTEHESVSAEEKTAQGESKPKGKSGCKELTITIIEEEFMKTPEGIEKGTGKTVRTVRVGKTEETEQD